MEPGAQIEDRAQAGCLMTLPARAAAVIICLGLAQSWMLAWLWAFRREDYEMIISISRIGDPFELGVTEGAELWIHNCHFIEAGALIALVLAGIIIGGRLRIWPTLVALLPTVPLLMAALVGGWFWLTVGRLPDARVWLNAWRAMGLAYLAGYLWVVPWYRPRAVADGADATDTSLTEA
ncbi:MAG TPA: hypothetical protein VM283_09230 [Armatimonadota bacterium]|nr:hypothetical protein [Armatimonadota bacterium]